MLLPEFLESIWRRHPIPIPEQQEIESFLAQQVKDIGICSLSKTRKNQLMWAHYANEHKGFCIGFDGHRLKETSEKFLSCLVEYSDDLPYKGVIERIKFYAATPYAQPEYRNSSVRLQPIF